MAISVTHSTVVATADDGTSDVSKDEWNAAHTVTGAVESVSSTDNAVVRFNGASGAVQDSDVLIDDNGHLCPDASDGGQLGTVVLMWSDLFLASGSVVNFNNGDVTLTHSADTLTLAGTDIQLVITGGTVTTSQPLLDLTQTWNDAAVTFTGLKLNVTSTASAAASLLLDLQVGSASKFQVNKSGGITMATGTSGNIYNGGGYIVFGDSDIAAQGGYWELYGSGLNLSAGLAIRFGNGGRSCIVDEAADVIAQRNINSGTNAQTFRVYSDYVSTTDYQRLTITSAKTDVTCSVGATVTATNLIPDGAVVVGLTTRVNTAIGNGSGTTGYQVGDGTDPDRWGAVSAIAAGTATQNADWTTTTIQLFSSAQSVVITAVGGNFDGTGSIEICVHYLIGEAT